MENLKLITLQTAHTTCQMGVTPEGFLLQLYYGPKTDDAMDFLLTAYDRGFEACPDERGTDRTFSMGVQPAVFPVYGNGDFRTPVFNLKDEDGVYGCDLRYVSHEENEGKYGIPGLPAVYAGDSRAHTVDILLKDARTGTEVTLRYGVMYDLDLITRSVHVENKGQGNVYLERVSSASLDLLSGDYDLIHFYGHHGMERITERTHLEHGVFAIGSKRGTSSHQHNPVVILADRAADEEKGSCYGFSFLYSGNFSCEAEVDSMNQTRLVMGMQPEMLSWRLAPGEVFDAPEMMMAYTDQGLTALSHIFHKAIRHHVVRGPHKVGPRPVLINNWEATYFDFDTEKLLSIAREASALGIEMLVMDDGWFGHRNSDNSSLGDWFVNEDKIKGGLKELVRQVNALGMKFGIWFEPEMISPDSELYKAHPDWAIQVQGREMTLCREQYVLDFSRAEVRDYVYDMMKAVLDSANIEYIKWDMNRQITDCGSSALPPDRQKELWHRYVLGVYSVMERLLADYPDILLENCSGGGGRFDPGMLYYSPQIWCSDDTDAIERLKIQHGTSLCYPCSAIGAHVSDCPNHTVGRNVPFATRGRTAMVGTFGYELDITKISQEDRDAVPGQIAEYKKYEELIRLGDQYRIGDIFSDSSWDAWLFASKDKTEAVFVYIQVMGKPNRRSFRVKLRGLDPEKYYYEERRPEVKLSGAALMNCGVDIGGLWGDYQSELMHFISV